MRGDGHWVHHARQWARIGAPLRPGPEDVAIMASLTGGVRRALLLGVTPELATLAWPADATLVAVDRSRAMIGAIFPSTQIRAQALVGDWCALPLADGAIDLAVGDGCLTNLPYP
ncbi:MAG: class I SAM-dependent methyltransferase, partial [Proteobacteria bacterium]|nr:class I SAM-dependent methyltransferase [Pseudomonadota bacterium]